MTADERLDWIARNGPTFARCYAFKPAPIGTAPGRVLTYQVDVEIDGAVYRAIHADAGQAIDAAALLKDEIVRRTAEFRAAIAAAQKRAQIEPTEANLP